MNRLLRMVLGNLHIVPWGYWKLCHYAKHCDRYPEEERFDHIRKLMQRGIRAGNIDLKVTGVENLPEDNGFLMYANHQGLFDVVAIAVSFPRIIGTVYKKELKDIPFLKQVFTCTKSFAMDREDVRQSLEVIRAVTEEVQKGRNYLIFPEGTRSKNGNVMGDFHAGSFRAALKAKCPVVPMAFINSFQVLDSKGSAPVTVQLHYLEPIPYEVYGSMKTGELAELVKSRIQEAIEQNT